MPSSCLHQLIISLPPKDRLALFQTCSSLSKVVVVSTPSVTLQLHKIPPWQYSSKLLRVATSTFVFMLIYLCVAWALPRLACLVSRFTCIAALPAPLELLLSSAFKLHILLRYFQFFMQFIPPLHTCHRARRIARLLNARCSFRLIAYGDMCLRQSLHQHVTALEHQGNSYILWRFQWPWADFTSLKQLTITGPFGGKDLKHLDMALQAGSLQQLRQLALYDVYTDVLPQLTRTTASRLGPSLTHSATDNPQVWAHQLHSFTALQAIDIGQAALEQRRWKQRYTGITSTVMRLLCQHPTLSMVTFRACTQTETWDGPQLSCTWANLILDGTFPRILAALSMTSLQRVSFVNGLPSSISDSQQLRRLLAADGLKLTCSSDTFFLSGLSAEVAQLIARFEGVRTLTLLQPSLYAPLCLPVLWEALPVGITSLEVHRVNNTLPVSIWQGLPRSISRIHVNTCNVTAETLAESLESLPAHVRTVQLTPIDRSQLLQWVNAELCNSTPDHVMIEVCAVAEDDEPGWLEEAIDALKWVSQFIS